MIPFEEMTLYLKGDAELLHRDSIGRIILLKSHKGHEYFGTDFSMVIIDSNNDLHEFTKITSLPDVFLSWVELQKAIVNRNGLAIMHIPTPSEEVMKLAVQQDGHAILWIDNPSEEIQKLAVQEYGMVIRHIDNPSHEVQKLAVQQNGYTIDLIDNPSHEVQKLAVQQNGRVIEFIKNPSEEMKEIARANTRR